MTSSHFRKDGHVSASLQDTKDIKFHLKEAINKDLKVLGWPIFQTINVEKRAHSC